MLRRIHAYALLRINIHGSDPFAALNSNPHEISKVILALGVFVCKFFQIRPEPIGPKTEKRGIHFPNLELIWSGVLFLNDIDNFSLSISDHSAKIIKWFPPTFK